MMWSGKPRWRGRAAAWIAARLGAILLTIPLWAPRAARAADDFTRPIDLGEVWSYLDDATDQGTAWREPAFDDVSWPEGRALFGVGHNDEPTLLSRPASEAERATTFYFRHRFQAADPSAVAALHARFRCDDGMILYLNGVEVLRDNMPAGDVDYLTTATTAAAYDGYVFREVSVDAASLVAGENVAAVELHQSDIASSDARFDMELRAFEVAPEPTRLVRGPYLQTMTSTSVVVCWRTTDATTGHVAYGVAPGPLDASVDEPTSGTEHRVRLTGLEPATEYEYALSDDEGALAGTGAEFRFTTHPVAGTARPVRILAVGDAGSGMRAQRDIMEAFLAMNAGAPPDVWLQLGDNAYFRATDPEYQSNSFDVYARLYRRTASWTAFGNHEDVLSNSSSQSGPYYDIFDLPRAAEAGGVASGTEAYYSFDYARVHFICLDSSGSSRAPAGAMLTWLAADLDANVQPWTIAFWHHPPYSKGVHDSDTEINMVEMRENVLPMLEAAGVDLALTGHCHSYERSYLLDGHYGDSTTLLPAMILDAGDGDPTGDGAYRKPPGATPRAGAVYLVAGASGQTDGTDVNPPPLNHPANLRANFELGGAVIDVLDDITMNVIYLRDDGTVRDRFTIEKLNPVSAYTLTK